MRLGKALSSSPIRCRNSLTMQFAPPPQHSPPPRTIPCPPIPFPLPGNHGGLMVGCLPDHDGAPRQWARPRGLGEGPEGAHGGAGRVPKAAVPGRSHLESCRNPNIAVSGCVQLSSALYLCAAATLLPRDTHTWKGPSYSEPLKCYCVGIDTHTPPHHKRTSSLPFPTHALKSER